jgi:hypothetical protein
MDWNCRRCHSHRLKGYPHAQGSEAVYPNEITSQNYHLSEGQAMSEGKLHRVIVKLKELRAYGLPFD